MKAITFKEKQETLEEIFIEYKRLLTKKEFLKQKNFYPSIEYNTIKEKQVEYNRTSQKLNHYIEEKEKVDYELSKYDFVLKSLSKDYRTIIKNEFIDRKKNWWVDYYSRSTYYRLKSRAMEETLFYISCVQMEERK